MAEVQTQESVQVVAFNIENEEYGANILKVTTIERALPVARVPRTPQFVKGVINLRGEIIPVVSLRQRLGFPEIDETEDTRIIIIKIGEIVAGFYVDAVTEVLQIDTTDIERNNNVSSDYISGLGKVGSRIVTLLNLEKLTTI
jgi:purine-binding chemotaxis protein CheW